MTYSEAVEILTKHKDKFEYPVFWGCDLQTEHERFFDRTNPAPPVFLIDYPRKSRRFICA
jgi:asparaginyl-tRNA synthetase